MLAEARTGSPPPMSGDGGGKSTQKGMVNGRRSGVAGAVLGIILLLLLAGVTALVLFLVYRPSKPRFTVVGAAIYELNATAAPASVIFSSIQITVAIRNPNVRSSISYDRLTAYVTYRGQPITPPAPLPPLEQGEESTVAMSPVLGGGPVGVPPEVAGGLVASESYGVVALRLVVIGRIRYRPGPFHSARIGMFVGCDLMVGYRRGLYGQVPLLASAGCSVDT